MKVILREHVHSLGQKGEIKEVSDGYYQNFLAPRKLASPATPSQVKHLKSQETKATEKLEQMKESAQAVFKRVNNASITIKRKTTEKGHLYAALNPREIAMTLREELKLEIPEEKIDLENPIKQIGIFTVYLKLYKDLNAELKVHVLTQ